MTITLPIEWIKKLNLKKREEVDVIDEGDSLIISGKQKNEEKSATLDISNFIVPMLWKFFQSIYRKGYNEVKIIFEPSKKTYPNIYQYFSPLLGDKVFGKKHPSKPAIETIQDLVNRFIGMEIIETGKNYCIVKDMTEPTTKEYNNAFRRIFMLISGMFERTLSAIEKDEIGDTEICEEIHALDTNIDRFIDYCCRMLNKVNNSAPQSKKPAIFSTLFILELLSDEFKDIADHLAITHKKVKILFPLAEKVREHFNFYEKTFFKFEGDLAMQFGKNSLSILDEHLRLNKKIKGENKSITRHLMQISKYLLSLIELRIEMEY